MNLLVKNGQTPDLANVDRVARGFNPGPSTARLRWFVWPIAMCIALVVSPTAAQEDAACAKAKSDRDAVKTQKTQKAVVPGSGCGSKTEKPCQCGSKKQVQKTTPGKDSQLPRWVCPEPTVTLDPVWHGQEIECTFTVRNEGKSDLRIREKRG